MIYIEKLSTPSLMQYELFYRDREYFYCVFIPFSYLMIIK